MKLKITALILFTGLLIACGEKQPGPVPGGIEVQAQKRDYWPTDSWQKAAPEKFGINAGSLQHAVDYLFTTTGNEENRAGIRTDGLVIIKNGYIVSEKYARGYTATTPHYSWSVSKSFTSALIGIAEKQGLLSRDDRLLEYYPDASASEEKKKITIDHLLRMSSGLYWEEDYEYAPLKSSVVAMLYTAGTEDMASFAAAMPVDRKPGTHYLYSSGTTNILMGILKKVVPEDEYATYPWDVLFEPIGMQNVTWERDSSGTFVGSSYLHAPPRQLAKFAYLYLNDGMWDGERILPEGWVEYSTTVTPAFGYMGDDDLYKEAYGAQWYPNAGRPGNKAERAWPAAPEDTFSAMGHWGQRIIVIPSYDLVIVRTADDRDSSYDQNRFLELLLAAMPERGES